MCDQGLPATPESEAITVCWNTDRGRRWDTGYAGEVIDGYQRDYPNARNIKLCVNGEHVAGWIRHG